MNTHHAITLPKDPLTQTRRLVVLASAVFAVVVGQAQQLLDLGQSPAEFAADSDATMKVAGWAFAIWGPIYIGLIVYAIRQVLPKTPETGMLKAFGWPSMLALLAIGWWILAAAWDAEIATIVLIFGALTVLLIPLLRNAGAIRGLARGDRDRWMTVWPLAALAGWLTVAAPVNLLTVATGNGDLPTALPPTAWALIAVALASAMGLFVVWRTRILAYPIPIAWGLIGVFAAEQDKSNAVLAFGALGAALVVLGGSLVIALRLRPRDGALI